MLRFLSPGFRLLLDETLRMLFRWCSMRLLLMDVAVMVGLLMMWMWCFMVWTSMWLAFPILAGVDGRMGLGLVLVGLDVVS